jgi:hypothetical protein
MTFYTGLVDFRTNMDKYVTKGEFQNLASEMIGSNFLITATAGVIYDNYLSYLKKEYPEKQNVHLIELLDYTVNVDTLISKVVDDEKKAQLTSVVEAFEVLDKNCAYTEFLPIIADMVNALTGGEREIPATDEQVKQVYIMYFRSQNAIPDDAIKGDEIVRFTLESLKSNDALSGLIDEETAFIMEDALSLGAFTSDEESRVSQEMTDEINKLMKGLKSKMSLVEVKNEALTEIYGKHVIEE